MSYVKNFEVGSVGLDTPNKHIVHELPLLSFGDARNTFALSLIFQSKLTSNPFYIANGYKLSLQKRIIFSGGYPQSYEDGNGTLTTLNRFNNKYAFDDGSHRFIRLINGQYVLENTDYSTEVYNTSGNLLSVKDKYGNIILSYTYSSGKLISVVYKCAKSITLGYSGSALQYIQYTHSGATYKTTFAYSGSKVIVSHYSGVDYHLTYSSGNFEVFSANAGGAFSNDLSYKDSVIVNGNLITIEKYHGNKKLDKVVYNFVKCDSTGKTKILDITDFQNVTTRVQFAKEKPAYSYELLDTMFVTHPTTNDPYYPGRVTFYNNEQVSGSQGYGDGVALNSYTGYSNDYSALHNFSGLMTVSGWLMPSYDVTECNMLIYNSDDQLIGSYIVDGLVKDVWTYFTVSFFEENSTSIHVLTRETPDVVWAHDLRLSGQTTSSTEAEYKDNLTKASGVLIYTDSNGKDIPIPITDTVEYINGTSTISKTGYPITINDLMRFKINQAIGTHTGEIYYNDGRGILALAGVFYIRYSTPDGTVITASLNDLAIGKMYTSKGNVYVTKTNFSIKNGLTRLETKSLKNSYEIRSEIYDSNLDLIESKVEGVTTKYVRNAANGLVKEQTIKDANNTSAITSFAVYDANDFLVSTTDEFGVVTVYTTDRTWGVVTKSAVTNGLTVTDTFDDDCSTQKSRSFGNGTTKKNEFTYFYDGLLYTIKNDTLNYTLGYSADILTSVTNNNEPMGQINISNDRRTMTTYYPGFLEPEYSITQRYDKYGRLTKIDGLITNTYDVNPTHSLTLDSAGVTHVNFSVVGKDNGSGKLATSTDHITGNTTKYGYKNNNISCSVEYDSAGNKVYIESASYDEFNRPKRKTCVYDPSDMKHVTSTVSYTSNDSNAYEGDTVKTCTYKLNDIEKFYTANSFDSFKRLSAKTTKLNQNEFIKRFTYNGSRVSGISDTVLNMNLGTNGYSYDSMGRITSNTYSSKNTTSHYRTYKYDQYGQLIRENNEGLDKTFIYEYNSIGNIERVKEYDFSLSDTPSGTYTETVYSYDGTFPDRLTGFNGAAIYYDSMGYPTVYDNKHYSWTKGRLSGICIGAVEQSGSLYENCVFTYDAYGRRLSKNYTYDPNPASTSDYSYTYNTTYNYDNSGRLIREYCTETYIGGATVKREFIYLYDESGIVGVLYGYNDSALTPYYYHRNLQGDVIAIYDASGYTQAEYTYDAWGNCTVTNSTLYDLAHNNPIRYRGYYYDRETGLYYLNARYYNPEWRRFISPDSWDYLDSATPNGLNLYAYCGNDPVNYKQRPVSSGSSVISSSISVGGSTGIGGSSGGSDSVSNGSAPWYAQTIVGALPDLYSGARYLMAKGMHEYFAYKKNYYYMFPILGKTHKRLAIHSTSFGKLSNATFKELVTGNAKASIGSVIGNIAGVGAFTFGTNLLFNLHENGFVLTDEAMWIDTGIDTAIGMGAYGLAMGTASLATAGLAMAGVALPGIVVIGGVIILSIGFDHLIRAISGYWD